jgi:hypothetical protein
VRASLDRAAGNVAHPTDRRRFGDQVRIGIGARRLRERNALTSSEQLQRHSRHTPRRHATPSSLARRGAGTHRDIGDRRRQVELHDAGSPARHAIAQHHDGPPLPVRASSRLGVVTHDRLDGLVAQCRRALGDVRMARVERRRDRIDRRAAKRIVRLTLEQLSPARTQQRPRAFVVPARRERDPRLDVTQQQALEPRVLALL